MCLTAEEVREFISIARTAVGSFTSVFFLNQKKSAQASTSVANHGPSPSPCSVHIVYCDIALPCKTADSA